MRPAPQARGDIRNYPQKASKAIRWRVAHVGGNLNNGDQAGFAALNANNSSANRNTNTGAHVCFENELRAFYALPHGKTQNEQNGAGSHKVNAPGSKQMKRYGNLYSAICDPDNIDLAFHNASKGKAHYRGVRRMRGDLERHLKLIADLLMSKTFRNAPYDRFMRTESGKRREIFRLPFFPDRIIHHAICQVLQPIWMNQYIRDTFSCIPGRGIHDCARRVRKALDNDPQGTAYCLKMDIKKFYPSIDNEIMKQILRRKIKCADTLWLLDEIVDSTKGLPIGNYLSQHLSNLYLSEFDHYVKEQLRAPYYYRYCDDIVLLSSSKQILHEQLDQMRSWLAGHLRLSVKKNHQVFPVASRGIDFVGYRFFHRYTLLRKGIATRFKRKAKRLAAQSGTDRITHRQPSIASYYGWLKHADCHNLKQKYLM